MNEGNSSYTTGTTVSRSMPTVKLQKDLKARSSMTCGSYSRSLTQ